MACRKACDRCSRRKDKCRFDDESNLCAGCREKGLKCTFQRSRRRIGRPAVAKNLPFGNCEIIKFEMPKAFSEQRESYSGDGKTRTPNPRSDLSASYQANTHSSSPIGLSHQSISKVPNATVWHVLRDDEAFYLFHRYFMIGRGFQNDFQQAVLAVSSRLDGLVFNGYQAVLALWDEGLQQMRSLQNVDVSPGTDCLRRLQNITIANCEDASAILMASLVLIVFHTVTLCTSPRSIRRNALFKVAPYYDKMLLQPSLDAITVTPMFIDTIESLVRREVPVISKVPSDRYIIDRSLGICWPLLPMLQELCQCSAEARDHYITNDDRKQSDGYTDIEHKIRHWEPEPPIAFFDSYTSLATAAMLLQARVYRLTALLIIHRLRFPLGSEDGEGIRIAKMIYTELSAFFIWAPDELKGLPIALPLLVAMLECREPGLEIMPKLPTFVFHPRHEDELRRFIDHVWSARNQGFSGLWFDLVEGFELPVLP